MESDRNLKQFDLEGLLKSGNYREVSTKEALAGEEPVQWPKEVLEGKCQVIVSLGRDN
jgi:hypothetical protein